MLATKCLKIKSFTGCGHAFRFSRFLSSQHHGVSVGGQSYFPHLAPGSEINDSLLIQDAHNSTSRILKYSTTKALSNFKLSQDVKNQPYHCPSRLLEQFSDMVILDTAVTPNTTYDLPMTPALHQPIIAPNLHDNEIVDPPPSNLTDESRAKHCKFGIMKIRHLKMKKHKKKKLLKKMYFRWKLEKERKEAKELALHKKDLASIKQTGHDFDANVYVQDQLAKGRRGGYFINIFESQSRV